MNTRALAAIFICQGGLHLCILYEARTRGEKVSDPLVDAWSWISGAIRFDMLSEPHGLHHRAARLVEAVVCRTIAAAERELLRYDGYRAGTRGAT